MNNENLIEVARVVERNPAQNLLKKDPENKVYLLCIAGKDGANDSWDLIIGRTELYETIKNSIEYIDLDRSFVLVESAKLENRKSIVAFMKYAERFFEDSFDIEDYIKGDWDEDDYRKNNEIDSMFMINNHDKALEMKNFLNGDINSTPLE